MHKIRNKLVRVSQYILKIMTQMLEQIDNHHPLDPHVYIAAHVGQFDLLFTVTFVCMIVLTGGVEMVVLLYLQMVYGSDIGRSLSNYHAVPDGVKTLTSHR